jgi:hypothetical protein
MQPSDDAAATAVVAIVMAEMGHLASEVVVGADQMQHRCLGCMAGSSGRLPARDLRILDTARQVFAMHLKSYRHTRRIPPHAPAANLMDGSTTAIDATVRRRFAAVMELAERLEESDWLPGSEVGRVLAGE